MRSVPRRDPNGSGAGSGGAQRTLPCRPRVRGAHESLCPSCRGPVRPADAGSWPGAAVRLRASRDHDGDGLSRWPGRRGSTYGGESRASGHACDCSAEMCASSCSLLRLWRGARSHDARPRPEWIGFGTASRRSTRFSATWTAPEQASRRTRRTVLASLQKFKRGCGCLSPELGHLEQGVPGPLRAAPAHRRTAKSL